MWDFVHGRERTKQSRDVWTTGWSRRDKRRIHSRGCSRNAVLTMLSYVCLLIISLRFSLIQLLIEKADLKGMGAVRTLRFSNDRQFLYAGSHDGSLSVFADPKARSLLLDYSIRKAAILGPSATQGSK